MASNHKPTPQLRLPDVKVRPKNSFAKLRSVLISNILDSQSTDLNDQQREDLYRRVSEAVDRILSGGKVDKKELERLAKQFGTTLASLASVGPNQAKPRPPAAELSSTQVRPLALSRLHGMTDTKAQTMGAAAPAGLAIPPTEALPHGVSLNEWAAMIKYQDDRVVQEKAEREKRVREAQIRMRADLDAQLQERDQIRARQKEEELRFLEAMNTRMQRYKEEEQLRQNSKQRRLDAMRVDQMHNIESVREQREAVHRKKLADDALRIRQLQEEMQEERNAQLVKKKSRAEEVARVKIENQRQLDLIQERRAKEKAEDEALMKRQIELLDKQEMERLNKLNDAKKYQQQREAAADLMAEKRRLEEERIERQMQEKIREINEKHNNAEREKKERMMYNRQVTNDTLAAQIEEQRLRREMERAEAAEQQDRLMRELEYEKQREAEKQRAKRVKNIAHRKLLEMQMRDGLKRRAEAPFMNPTEAEVNAPLLKKVIEGPPDLVAHMHPHAYETAVRMVKKHEHA